MIVHYFRQKHYSSCLRLVHLHYTEDQADHNTGTDTVIHSAQAVIVVDLEAAEVPGFHHKRCTAAVAAFAYRQMVIVFALVNRVVVY